MFLSIQKAFKRLNYKYYKRITIWYWIIVWYHFIYFIYCLITFTFYDYKVILVAVTVIYFEVHSTIVLSILILIKEGIITWTSEFQCYGQVCWRIGDEESKRHMKVLFQVYVDLLKAFDLFKKTHHSIVRWINIDRILTFVTNSIDMF